MKLTREQAQQRKDQAVRFVDDVLGDSDRAAEIDDESLDDYASRRKIQLLNPEGGGSVARINVSNPKAMRQANQRAGKTLTNNGGTTSQSKQVPGAPVGAPAAVAPRVRNRNGAAPTLVQELQTQIDELQRQNDEYQNQLDRIADLASCDDPECQEEVEDLMESLNDILDIAAAGDVEDDEEDDGDDPGE